MGKHILLVTAVNAKKLIADFFMKKEKPPFNAESENIESRIVSNIENTIVSFVRKTTRSVGRELVNTTRHFARNIMVKVRREPQGSRTNTVSRSTITKNYLSAKTTYALFAKKLARQIVASQ